MDVVWKRIKTYGGKIVTLETQGMATLEELLVSSLATADALVKFLIKKGLIDEPEFREMLATERAAFRGLFRKKIN